MSSVAEVVNENLWTNSTFEYGFKRYVQTPNSGEIAIVDGHGGKKAVKISRFGYSGYNRSWVNTTGLRLSYKAGDTYTLSAWIYVNSALDSANTAVMVRGECGAVTTFDAPQISVPSDTPAGKWIHLKATHTFDADGKLSNGYVLLGKNGSISVSKIKLEKGEEATAWVPHLSDGIAMNEEGT